MIQDIITGIAQKLDEKYGYPVHTERIEQGLSGPCFYIKLISSSGQQLIGPRYTRRLPFDVHFFPGETDKNSQIYTVSEDLYDVLEYVGMGDDLVKATGMNHEVVDEVLHFMVNYNLILIKPSELIDAMDGMNINTQI